MGKGDASLESWAVDASLEAWALDFMVGGVSAAVVKTMTSPIERVKLLIQTQDANPLIRSGEVPRYTGIGNCLSRVHTEQGFRAFWRGNFTNCIRYFPTQAFQLSFKDSIRRMLPKYHPRREFFQSFGVNVASGSMAAAGTLCIVYPLDYARTRLASDVGGGKKTFSGLVDCLKRTAGSSGGPLALYSGFGVSLMGIIPYRGFQLGAFDTIVGLNPYRNNQSIMGALTTLAAAQIAITAGAAISYPFDTVRRRLQMQAERPIKEHVYQGTSDCLKKIAAEEGVRKGLYKGFLANILRSVGGALVLVFYDRAKLALDL